MEPRRGQVLEGGQNNKSVLVLCLLQLQQYEEDIDISNTSTFILWFSGYTTEGAFEMCDSIHLKLNTH